MTSRHLRISLKMLVFLVQMLIHPTTLVTRSIIMKSSRLTWPAIAIFLASFSSSLFPADTLSSNYNLGRLPFKGLCENAFVWSLFDSDNLNVEVFRFRTGGTKGVSLGMTPALMAFSSKPNIIYFQLIPETDLAWSPGSNRFQLSLMPMNLAFIGTEYGGGSGFDTPFIMLNNFEWNGLSREGRIAVEPRQYELAFLYGPQLNPGQFKNRLVVSHTINGDTIPYRKFAVDMAPQIGVAGGLQLRGGFHYSFVDSVTEVIYSYSSDGEDQRYSKSKTDSLNIGLGLEFRYAGFMANMGGGFFKWEEIERNYLWGPWDQSFNDTRRAFRDVRLNLSLAHIAGHRIASAQEIEGNWDGFESRWLGKEQLLNEINLVYVPSRKIDDTRLQYQDDREIASDFTTSLFTLNQRTRFGAGQYAEIGDRYTMIVEKGKQPYNRLGLVLTSCNIPLRQYGPDNANDQEYFHGISFAKSQYFLSLTGYLPLLNKPTDYQFVPIYELVRPAGAIMTAMQPLANDQAGYLPGIGFLGDGALLHNAGLSFSIACAPSDWVTFANELELKKFDFKRSVRSSNTGTNYQTQSASSNIVFSDFFSLIFNVAKTGRLSLSALYAKQSDTQGRNVDKSELAFWAIFFSIQGAVGTAK
jgi:hypothetical protein